ncbi:hypothetical protein K488DRAFT_74692 [Vararia minispora EC-137]|uniref:Uncharacterized protein n=1 Tax=Vararia minispora EC-137 TaxID=1314806 RepID=A0ACB8Q6A6_9AGAM|nr:hypothetical protein K488DRAFT_74692 [Vararia minispora EC-137]
MGQDKAEVAMRQCLQETAASARRAQGSSGTRSPQMAAAPKVPVPICRPIYKIDPPPPASSVPACPPRPPRLFRRPRRWAPVRARAPIPYGPKRATPTIVARLVDVRCARLALSRTSSGAFSVWSDWAESVVSQILFSPGGRMCSRRVELGHRQHCSVSDTQQGPRPRSRAEPPLQPTDSLRLRPSAQVVDLPTLRPSARPMRHPRPSSGRPHFGWDTLGDLRPSAHGWDFPGDQGPPHSGPSVRTGIGRRCRLAPPDRTSDERCR